jgi:endo-1,4-beta-xylanase
MKKNTYFNLALVLWVSLYMVQLWGGGISNQAYAAGADGTTSVQSDFEDGTVQGWYGRWGPTVAAVSNISHGGSNSLLTTGRDDGWKGPALGVKDKLTEGAKYQIEGWVRTVAADSVVSMTMLRQHDGGQQDYLSVAYQVPVKSSEWTKLSGTFTYDQTAESLDLYFESPNATLEFYIDDVTITLIPALSTDFLDDFEDGTTQGWVPRIGPETVAVSQSFAHSGSSAILISGRTASYFGAKKDVLNKLDPGSSYAFSVWAKLPNGVTDTQVGMTMQRDVQGEATHYESIAKVVANAGGWVQIQGVYNLKASAQALSVYFESSDPTVSFFIDDFKMTKQIIEPMVIQTDIPSLKDVFKDDFLIGTAFLNEELTGANADLIIKHFNSITPGNILKPDHTEPIEGQFNFADGDAAVAFAETNGIKIRGHTLVWHNQTPDWYFKDANGNPVTKDVLFARLKNHIQTEVTRYKGKMYAWDVVNEAMDPAETDGLRHSLWYQLGGGEEYIEKAFLYAHEADPDAKLYINEYNEYDPVKRQDLYDLVKRMKDKGVPIDGVGMQMHISIDNPSVQQIDDTLSKYEELGVEIQITELDMDVNPTNSLTAFSDQLALKQAYRYKDIFNVLKKHKGHLKSVTFWGKDDGNSWLRTFPVSRSNWPLLFDNRLQAKPAYWGIVDPSKLPVYTQFIDSAQATPKVDGKSELSWEATPGYKISSNGMLSEVGSFKTAWDNSHLYVIAEVKDATKNPQDTFNIYLDRNNGKTAAYESDDMHYTLKRNGKKVSNAAYKVIETTDGYRIEASIPLVSAVLNQTVGFDIRVNDADQPQSAVSWNDTTNNQDTNTSKYGSVKLVSAVNVSEAIYGTPNIDGNEDAIWAKAKEISVEKWVQGTSGSTAKVKTMWDKGHLYVLAKVLDDNLSKASSNTYEQDTVEFFVDQNNGKTSYYQGDDGQYRVNYMNETSFNGAAATANHFQTVVKLIPSDTIVTQRTNDGYIIEASISLSEIQPQSGTVIGFDVQVNNDSNADGKRDSVATWNDGTGNSYQNTSNYGALKLMKSVNHDGKDHDNKDQDEKEQDETDH